MSGASSQQPVWAKRVGDAAVARVNVDFCAGYDVAGRPAADSRLAPYDLQTNAAHLLMLVSQDVIHRKEGRALAGALLELKKRIEAGEEVLRPSCEDIHMSIETAVTELVGTGAGGRLHTGRSRNDQVATDMRLWLRDAIVKTAEEISILAETIANHAEKHVNTVCPGFTHGQPGMVTSWGHWTMSYLPRLLRDLRALTPLLRDLSTCPLGAAASFGTSWPLHRELTAKLLGFAYPTPSGADGIWCRGEMEARYAFAVAEYLAHLSGIGQDIILLSSPPRTWLRLADEHVTGSSIMPQKRNPDFAEVTRARAHVAAGIAQSLLGIGTALQSGYNRDTQWTKYKGFDAADNAAGAGPLFAQVFERMTVSEEGMLAACQEGFLNATDVADHLARTRNLPFRTCYKVIGAAVRSCDKEGALVLEKLNQALRDEQITELNKEEWSELEDPRRLLHARSQTGNPHPEETLASIRLLREEVREEYSHIASRYDKWQEAIVALWDQLDLLARGEV